VGVCLHRETESHSELVAGSGTSVVQSVLAFFSLYALWQDVTGETTYPLLEAISKCV